MLAIAAAYVAARWLVLPAIARAKASQVLASLGFAQATFDIDHATFFTTRISRLRLDADSGADHVDVGYSPLSLWRGGVHAVATSGLRLAGQPATATILAHAPAGYLLSARIDTPDQPLLIEGELSGDAWQLSAHGELLDASIAAGAMRTFLPDWRLTASGKVQLKATWSRKTDAQHRIDATVEARDVAVRFADVNDPKLRHITGVFQVAGEFSPYKAMLTVSTDNASFASGYWTAELGGISGRVLFTSLSPLATADSQHLRVRNARVGELHFENGDIRLRLRDGHLIDVEKTKWQWMDGTIAAAGFTLDTHSPVVELAIEAEKLDLEDLLATFASTHASGTGRVSGRIPVRIDWPRLTFGRGRITAAGDGTLQVRDVAALAAALPAGDGTTTADEVRRRVLAALADYSFQELAADLANDDGWIILRLHLAGRGRTGARQAVTADINLRIQQKFLDGFLWMGSRGR